MSSQSRFKAENEPSDGQQACRDARDSCKQCVEVE